jgi:hypothetical protein
MAKKPAASVRKGKARPAKEVVEGDAEFVVEEETEVVVKPAMGLESGLIAVTFVALIAAFVLVELKHKSSFGAIWP